MVTLIFARYIFFIFLFTPAYSQSFLENLQDKSSSDWTLDAHFKKDIGVLIQAQRPQERAFLQAFKREEYDKSLDIWLTSMKLSSFAKTSNGKALFSFLLFKNGWSVLALTTLFGQVNANRLHPIIKDLWKFETAWDHPVWDYFAQPVSVDWARVFSNEKILNIALKLKFDHKQDISYLESLLKLSKKSNMNLFPLHWDFLLNLIYKGDNPAVAKAIRWLLNEKNSDKSLIYLTIARLLAQNLQFKPSLFYYKKIRKNSPSWFFAQEEQAWVYYKQNDYSRSQAYVSIFNTDRFQNELTEDRVSLLALSQMKTCDYKNFLDTFKLFKDKFSQKNKFLFDIKNKKLQLALEQYDKYNQSASYDAFSFPFSLRGNRFLKNSKRFYDFSSLELSHLKKKFSGKIYQNILSQNEVINKNIYNKIKKVFIKESKKELKKIQQNLHLFSLMEAEVLYRIYGFHSLGISASKAKLASGSHLKKQGVLIFPFQKNEIWLDEINDYAAVKNTKCPSDNYVL